MANQYPTSTVAVDSTGKVTTTTFSYGSPILTKTAAYQVQASDSGTIFTTTGAGSTVAFTLPAVQSGLSFAFIATAAVTMTVAGASGSIKGGVASGGPLSGTTLTVLAGTAANQFTYVRFQSDGINWLVTDIQGVAAVA